MHRPKIHQWKEEVSLTAEVRRKIAEMLFSEKKALLDLVAQKKTRYGHL